MAPKVFISYSRRNRPFAERLRLDLLRSGLQVWHDLPDIPLGADFDRAIHEALSAVTHVVLLASPEAKVSDWVPKEVEEAKKLGKEVILLRLAGKPGTMLPEWEKLNMIENAGADYWTAIRRMVKHFPAPNTFLPSIKDLVSLQKGTVLEAATELTGAEKVIDRNGREFIKLPIAPSAYCMAWLFVPVNSPMRWSESLAFMFNFTNGAPGDRYLDALTHWGNECADPTRIPSEPWFVILEGPINTTTRQYEIKTNQPHEWLDAIMAGTSLVEEFARGSKRLGLFFNSLVPLQFEIGVRTTMLTPRRRIYHYNTRTEGTDAGYVMAYDGWL